MQLARFTLECFATASGIIGLSVVQFTNERTQILTFGKRRRKDRKEETDKEARGVNHKSLYVSSEPGLGGMTRHSGNRGVRSSERSPVGVKALRQEAFLSLGCYTEIVSGSLHALG